MKSTAHPHFNMCAILWICSSHLFTIVRDDLLSMNIELYMRVCVCVYIYNIYIACHPIARQQQHELVHHSNCLQVGGKIIKALLYRCACLAFSVDSYAVNFFFFWFCIFQFFFCHFNYSRKKKKTGEKRSLQTISKYCVVAETPFPKLGKQAVPNKVTRPATTFFACPQAHISLKKKKKESTAN